MAASDNPPPSREPEEPRPRAKHNFGSPVEIVIPEQRLKGTPGEGRLLRTIHALKGKLATETIVCELTLIIRKSGVSSRKPKFYDETPIEEFEPIVIDG